MCIKVGASSEREHGHARLIAGSTGRIMSDRAYGWEPGVAGRPRFVAPHGVTRPAVPAVSAAAAGPAELSGRAEYVDIAFGICHRGRLYSSAAACGYMRVKMSGVSWSNMADGT
jgi:hypothetical protein